MSATHNVVICGGCLELVDRSGQWAWPGCACQPRDRAGTGYSPGKAFLCKCCTAALLIDSHKWTIFFCAHCRAHVAELNRTVGWPVIAYGTHPLVNQGCAPFDDPDGPPRRSGALRHTEVGLDVLNRRASQRVTQVLSGMGRADGADVAVGDYFAHVAHGPDAARQAFTELCDHVGVGATLHSDP